MRRLFVLFAWSSVGLESRFGVLKEYLNTGSRFGSPTWSATWRPLGAHLATTWCSFEAHLVPSWHPLGPLGAHLAPRGAHLAVTWRPFAPRLRQVGPKRRLLEHKGRPEALR